MAWEYFVLGFVAGFMLCEITITIRSWLIAREIVKAYEKSVFEEEKE